eukprot:GILJ01011618.1.p1 GENE.GILJ01011618.1~~GILJ01011618.1.p1  ORF type:complete len:893 (+),score=114.41 GILJ01011618.1:70-2748(+)
MSRRWDRTPPRRAPSFPDDYDTLTSHLDRSGISNTIASARASLLNPSRPFTPADPSNRALFGESDSRFVSRPQSAFTSLSSTTFIADTFGSPRRPTPPSASVASSLDGKQDEGFDIEDKLMRMALDRQQRYANARKTSGAPVRVSPPLQVHSPTFTPDSGSDSDEEYSKDRHPSKSSTTPRPPSSYRRRTSLTRSSSTLSSSSSSSLETNIQPAIDIPHESSSVTFAPHHVAVLNSLKLAPKVQLDLNELLNLSDQVWEVIQDLESEVESDMSSELRYELLRGVMGLLDCKHAQVLLRLCRCTLRLLTNHVESLSAEGATAGLLNTSKLLFKLSKKTENDNLFLQEKLLLPLLTVLETAKTPKTQSSDLILYISGTLKNLSHHQENQRIMAELGCISILSRLLPQDELSESSEKECQWLIQVTATLRNLATNKANSRSLLQHNVLERLGYVIMKYPQNYELAHNCCRILSKLTLSRRCCASLLSNRNSIRSLVSLLTLHSQHLSLLIRVAFILGNLTSSDSDVRVAIAFDFNGIDILSSFLYNLCFVNASNGVNGSLHNGYNGHSSGANASDNSERNDALVKIIRVIANISIQPEVGVEIASNSKVASSLLHLLHHTDLAEQEELSLNVASVVTNLLYYHSDDKNLLLTAEARMELTTLFLPLLMQHRNEEILMEAVRAFGNLSRHKDVRRQMERLRVVEALSILLDHTLRDLVFYVCGVFVNMSSDSSQCASLASSGCVVKLVSVVRDTGIEDPELAVNAAKVLANLCQCRNLILNDSDLSALKSLTDVANDCRECMEGSEYLSESEEKRQFLEDVKALHSILVSLTTQLTATDCAYNCPAPGCGRKFQDKDSFEQHCSRRHPSLSLDFHAARRPPRAESLLEPLEEPSES